MSTTPDPQTAALARRMLAELEARAAATGKSTRTADLREALAEQAGQLLLEAALAETDQQCTAAARAATITLLAADLAQLAEGVHVAIVTWSRKLPDDERAQFLTEMAWAHAHAKQTGDLAPAHQCLLDWHFAAEPDEFIAEDGTLRNGPVA